ncbi:hypothetical protein [Xylophilus sp. GOD-11R]|uniref:hypothetical protein n=1 Tax=Xylophilus sp. GOD-11R TaxID=3089814 RepID=UPI00298D52CD|nr:hypothetical protein [Xylophilus sp. GOD-11R]WPB58572.1 hypothetical protein R9X41_08030 [Xylophilus sp. GOD-11R]
MVCPASSYSGIRNDNIAWSNWSGRAGRTLKSLFVPAPAGAVNTDVPLPPPVGLQQLVRVVKDATDNARSVHAIGSGWAFDDQAIGDDWAIDIRGLRSRLLGTVGDAQVNGIANNAPQTGAGLTDSWRASQADRAGTRKLVHVEAGIKLWQLIQMLDGLGLALPTLGGANGQALAGVINTSVHGGDWMQPAFPGLVRALHLVTHGGREMWIEPGTAAITRDDRLKPTLSCPDVEIVRSDEIFHAAVVGMGRFGVVYAYVLEVRPQFWVAEVATRPDRNAVFAALRAGAATINNPFGALLSLLAQDAGPASVAESRSGAQPSFFQLLLSTRNPPGIWVQRRWETTDRSDLNVGAATDVSGDLVALGLNALLVANPLGSIFSALNPILDAIVNGVIDGEMKNAAEKGRRGRHAWVTAGPPSGKFPDYKGVSAEVMFDANNPAYVDFLQAILAEGGNFRQVGWLSLRPSRATTATLSMHNVGGTHAVSIEIALLAGMVDNERFMTFVQQKALALGGRLHWGQVNGALTPQTVSAQYGGMFDSWRRALWRVSGDSMVFSNQFSRQRGLEPVAARAQLAAAVPSPDNLLVARSGPLQSRLWSPTGGWTAWQNTELAVPQDAGPVELVTEGGRCHLFFVAGDGGVMFRTRAATGNWGIWWFVTTTNNEKPWQGVAGGAVHAVSPGLGSVHVFYATATGTILGLRGETGAGVSWKERRPIQNGRTAPGGHVTGVSRRPGQIDIFTVGTDRQVYTAAWNAAAGWQGWWAIPGVSAPPGAPVCAVSRRQDFIDIFVADDAGRTMSAAWQPGQPWKGWWHIQNGRTAPGGAITGVSRGLDQLDFFMVGTDSRLYSAAWSPGGGWGGWWWINNAVASRSGAAVPVVSRSTNLLDVFMVDGAGTSQTLAWAPGRGWGGPWPM